MQETSSQRLTLPLVPLRDLVVFPGSTVSLYIGRESSKAAVLEAMQLDRRIYLCTQQDSQVLDPAGKDIFKTGVIAEILQLLKLPDGTLKILVEGLQRARWFILTSRSVRAQADFRPLSAAELVEQSAGEAEPTVKEESQVILLEAEVVPVISVKTPGLQEFVQKLIEEYKNYAAVAQDIAPEFIQELAGNSDPGWICDQIAAKMPLPMAQKQELLEQDNLQKRIYDVSEIVLVQISLMELEKKIQKNVQERISKTQKDFYLGEKIKEIKKELGQEHDIQEETRELEERLRTKGLDEAAEKKLRKEIQKLEKTPPFSSEVAVLRNYIEWVLDLPWKEESTDNTDLKHAQEILEADHFGLEKVKDRVLDFIAVRRFHEKPKGPILCFVGPPGVGKTSLAKSIANSLEREFIRISLGGIKDEAEIRGHRKTYVAAMPGRILQSMKKSATVNPVFLLDEIDKLASDFRGDPASALLEVLDPEQNHAFQDHFLEIPYDLSRVLFIATANVLHRIPHPLRDRMEIIELQGYSELEKLQIARRFLVKRALENNALQEGQMVISQPRLLDVIRHYTKEAGVRSLQREIEKLARKSLRKFSEDNGELKEKKIFITRQYLHQFLGREKFRSTEKNPLNEVGYCQGMAWTELGGDLLGVEVVLVEGRGQFLITGNLGEVMQESVRAAMTFVRSIATKIGLDLRTLRKYDVHVHVPEGAIPKDGPSAGITLATAIISAYTGIPVRRDVAMTGEITLRGKVLPVGGIKEKVLAAHRARVTHIILPRGNESYLEEIPATVARRLRFSFVDQMIDVLPFALEKNPLESPLPGDNSIESPDAVISAVPNDQTYGEAVVN